MTYVEIRAVNFNATIFDTNDLSTIRGASYAANQLPKYALEILVGGKLEKVNIIVSAASVCLAKIPEDMTLDHVALKEKTSPTVIPNSNIQEKQLSDWLEYLLPHFTLIVSTSENNDFKCALDEISLQQAMAQSEGLGVCNSTTVSKNFENMPCQIDGIRPRQTKYMMPGDDGGIKVEVSWASALRREYGRGVRRVEYYTEYLGLNKDILGELDFTNSFSELVANPPEGVPYRLLNKVCVFSMDMTGLGERAESAEETCDTFKTFSKRQVTAQKDLLKNIAETAIENHIAKTAIENPSDWVVNIKQYDPATGQRESVNALRLETLMLGGDECVAIFPAWCLEDVIVALNKNKSDFKFGSGFVIAPAKTPIRHLKIMANELAENAKRAGPDCGLQYHITGHVDTAFSNIIIERSRIFELLDSQRNAEGKTVDLHRLAMTLDLKDAPKLFDAIKNLKVIDDRAVVSHGKIVKLSSAKNVTKCTRLGDKTYPGSIKVKDLLEYFPKNITGIEHDNYRLVAIHLAMLWNLIWKTSSQKDSKNENSTSGEDQ